MGANIITVCCSLSYMLICSICHVSIFMLCYVSLLSVCFVSIFSLCSVRFLVCVLFLFLVCVMCLCTLASLRSAGARFARCGRFAAAAAASRPHPPSQAPPGIYNPPGGVGGDVPRPTQARPRERSELPPSEARLSRLKINT